MHASQSPVNLWLDALVEMCVKLYAAVTGQRPSTY